VTQVAAGRSHALALLADGTVMAWGNNGNGQLGDGTTANRLTPVRAPIPSRAVAVAAGEDTSLALLADGTVMAWGGNGNGQLGDSEHSGPESCPGPVFDIPCLRAPHPVPGLSGVVAIAVGGAYSLALRGDGTVAAWGFDQAGTVGDGIGRQGGCSCVDRPTPVPGVSGAIAISAGEWLASALLSDGTVKAWAVNSALRL